MVAGVMGGGAMRTAWIEGGLRSVRPGSARPSPTWSPASPAREELCPAWRSAASCVITVDRVCHRRRDRRGRAVERDAPPAEADDARGVGQRGLELVLADDEREPLLDVDRPEDVHDAAGQRGVEARGGLVG